tara:strand:- start:24597 stop:25079 length:483 start_codon:yes stop_codon:yes gene_type:complete
LCDLDGNAIDEFSQYVQPTKNPTLSAFCTQLTTITQKNIDGAPRFEDAMAMLDGWVAGRECIWGSWGNFDRSLLLSQQQRVGREFQYTRLPHINLKKAWRRTTKQRQHNDLQSALRFHGVEFEGTPHRAISDARNTARLLRYIDRIEIDLQISEPKYRDQ